MIRKSALKLFFLVFTFLFLLAAFSFVYLYKTGFDEFQVNSDPYLLYREAIGSTTYGESLLPIFLWRSIYSLSTSLIGFNSNPPVFFGILLNVFIATISLFIFRRACIICFYRFPGIAPLRSIPLNLPSCLLTVSPFFILYATIHLRDIFSLFASALFFYSVVSFLSFDSKFIRLNSIFCLICTFLIYAFTRLSELFAPLVFLFIFVFLLFTSHQYISLYNLSFKKVLLQAAIGFIVILILLSFVLWNSGFDLFYFQDNFSEYSIMYKTNSLSQASTSSRSISFLYGSSPFIRWLFSLFQFSLYPVVFTNPLISPFSSLGLARSLSIFYSIFTLPLFASGFINSFKEPYPIYKTFVLFIISWASIIAFSSIEYRHLLDVVLCFYICICSKGYSHLNINRYMQFVALLFCFCFALSFK